MFKKLNVGNKSNCKNFQTIERYEFKQCGNGAGAVDNAVDLPMVSWQNFKFMKHTLFAPKKRT